MQFKRSQREELRSSWNAGSWFFVSLGPAARGIIACAYGIEDCNPKIRAKCQDDVTTAMSIFARKIGCDKSHAVHALLSGSIVALRRALNKVGEDPTDIELKNAWEASFRVILMNLTDSELDHLAGDN